MLDDNLQDLASYCAYNLPLGCEVHNHKNFPCLSQLLFKLLITSDGPHKTVCVCMIITHDTSTVHHPPTSTPILSFTPSHFPVPLSFISFPSSPLLPSLHPISSMICRSQGTIIQSGIHTTTVPALSASVTPDHLGNLCLVGNTPSISSYPPTYP